MPTAADPKRALVSVKEKLGLADRAFNMGTKIVNAKPGGLDRFSGGRLGGPGWSES